MSKIIKSVRQDVEITGNPKPPRSGAFEVTVDGNLVFSKFDCGRFPTEDEVKSWIG